MRRLVGLGCLVLVSAAVAATSASAAAPSLPPGFEPGRDGAHFLGRAPDGAVAIGDRGALLRLGRGELVRLRPRGARPASRVSAGHRLPGVVNRLHGRDPSAWRLGLPLFGRVRQAGLYPGIDLVFHFRRGALEYDWIVAPGASPRTIDLAVDGGRRLRLSRRGDLLMHTRAGVLRQRRPVAYQRAGGRRRPVAVRFVLRGKRRVGFAVGRYDRTRPLVIDPVVTFSSYVGGREADAVLDVALDPQGNTVLAGTTHSLDLPVKDALDGSCGSAATATCDAYLEYETPRPVSDAFVAKLSPTGQLVYATYLGGAGNDQADRIAVDGNGRPHLFGRTGSGDFPTTPGSYKPQRSVCGMSSTTPCEQMFVARLAADGASLGWATYLGGEEYDWPRGIAVDPAGAVYVAGDTNSELFPTTPGALGPALSLPVDTWVDNVFVTKFSADGSALAYSGVFGGESWEELGGLDVNAAGEAVLAGSTRSPDFPTTEGARQRYCDTPDWYDCNSDGFVVRVAADGLSLKQSSFLGGRAYDYVEDVVLDGQDRPLVAGWTNSEDFPARRPLDDKHEDGGAVVTRLTADLGAVDYSGLVSGDVWPEEIALAADGGAYVAGRTYPGQLPVRDAVQAVPGDKACYAAVYTCTEVFALRVAPDGNALRWSTYLGGMGDDRLGGLAARGGAVVAGGATDAVDFPTHAAFDGTPGRGTCRRSGGFCNQDGFVTRIDEAAAAGSPYDGFDRRRRLYATEGSLYGDSRTAAGGTVWFEWTAPANRTVAFDTRGSDFDTVVTVYRGTSADSLKTIASSDDHAGLATSRAVFRAVRGRAYKIALSGKGGGGAYKLEWHGAPPFNDAFDRPQDISGDTGTAGGSTMYSTLEPDEFGYEDDPVGHSIWYRWTAPATGMYEFDLSGSETGHDFGLYRGDRIGLLESAPHVGGGVFRVHAGVTYRLRVTPGYYSYGGPGDVALSWRPVPLPANDDFADAQAITGASGSLEAEAYGATRELLEPSHMYDPEDGGRSVWYRWTAPADGAYAFLFRGASWAGAVTAIYTGTSFSDLVRVDSAGSGEVMRFGTEAGRTYLIAVDVGAPFELAWTSTPTVANDLFKDAVVLAPEGGVVANDGRLASYEAGEPLAYTSTWYSWTAPAVEGPVTFVGGSMAIFVGDAVDALTLVMETTCCGSPGALTFNPVPGKTYRLQLRDQARTTLAWDFGRPANDAFADAPVLTGASGHVEGSMAHATLEAGEPNHSSSPSVWYSWTAPSTGPVSLTTAYSAGDSPGIAVYTGSSIGSLTYVVMGNDTINFSATAGTTYRFRVFSHYSSPFPFTFRWNETAHDTVPPEVLFTSPKDGSLVRGVTTLQAYASDRYFIEKVEFLLDGELLGPPTDQYSYSYLRSLDTRGLPDGPVQLAARAIDRNGNASESAPVTVTIDNTAPDTSILSAPSGTVGSRTATVKLAADEPVHHFRCRVDDGSWFHCEDTLVLEHLEDGPHTVEASSTDLIENSDPIPAHASWTVLGDEADPAPEPEPQPTPDPELPPEPTPEPSPSPSPSATPGPTGAPLGSPQPDPDGSGPGGSGGGTDTAGGGFQLLPPEGATIISRSPDGALRLTAGVSRGRVSRAALRRGLAVRLSCSTACRATARLVRGRRTIARGRRSLTAGARSTVRLRPSRRVVARLKRGTRLGLVIDAVGQDGTRVTIRRAVITR